MFQGSRSMHRALAVSVGMALLAGCATTSTTTRSSSATTDEPPAPARAMRRAPQPIMRSHASSPDEAIVDERQIRALYLEVSALLESARESLQAGEAEGAGVLYDEALRRLQESGLRPEDDAQLGAIWETVLTEVRDLEIDALARGEDAAGQPQDPTLAQDLEVIAEEIADTEIEDSGGESRAAEGPVYELPIEDNARVGAVLDYFTGRRREVIARGLQRSGRYLPMIREILKEEGLPEDLAWLPLIESGFKPQALSRAGAKGLWQFIPGTGRKYGLQIDWYVDERADPVKATRAAAAYLKDLHAMFGDWYLALAAYNCGEGRISRVIRRTGSRDFWSLARRRVIPPETRGYVPAFLAALTIGKDPARHGFALDTTEPWTYDSVAVEGPADLQVLAECAGTDAETLRALNPELRRGVTTGKEPYRLRLPVGASEPFQVAYAAIPENQRLLYEDHRVRPGETLTLIARRYGSSVQAITAENGIRNPHRIRVGALLRIPRSGVTSSGRIAQAAAPQQPVIHVVRRRENLTTIARRYGTSPGQIARINGLRSAHRIYPGQRLRITPGARGSGGGGGGQVLIHKVRRGDTLYGIARAYNTTVASLRRWNRVRGSRIIPGETIRIHR